MLSWPAATHTEPADTTSLTPAQALNCATISAGMRLDIPTYLPPEISVHIFRFLHPRDLCRYVFRMVDDTAKL